MQNSDLYAASDPAEDGFPETADADSYADRERDASRLADGPPALPTDREDGPAALDEYGTTAQEEFRGESWEARLARELPDIDVDPTDPDPALTDDADPSAVDQLSGDTESLTGDDPVDPHLDSKISMYDRPVAGVGHDRHVGRLVQPDQGAFVDEEATEIAYDAGLTGGGFSAEEAAMHEVAAEEPQSGTGAPGGPDVGVTRRPPVIRTGADQPWDPVDLAMAEGRDPTPRNVERARRELEEWGAAAIEKTVP